MLQAMPHHWLTMNVFCVNSVFFLWPTPSPSVLPMHLWSSSACRTPHPPSPHVICSWEPLFQLVEIISNITCVIQSIRILLLSVSSESTVNWTPTPSSESLREKPHVDGAESQALKAPTSKTQDTLSLLFGLVKVFQARLSWSPHSSHLPGPHDNRYISALLKEKQMPKRKPQILYPPSILIHLLSSSMIGYDNNSFSVY